MPTIANPETKRLVNRPTFPRWIKPEDVPPGTEWWTSVVWLWVEDDVSRSDESAEHLVDAVVRLLGGPYDCAFAFQVEGRGPGGHELHLRRSDTIGKRRDLLLGRKLAVHDGGDCTYHLHPGGWVVCHSYDGASLGRVVLESGR